MASIISSAASFRGAAFRVETEEYKGGRRAVVHVYPQRDKVYVEDLGRAPARFTVTGFVGGKSMDEARAARDALLNALEAPGSASLVLPGWTAITVSVEGDITCASASNQRGRYNFSFTVVKDDGLTYPSLGVNTTRSVELSADAMDSAAAQSFQYSFITEDSPDFVSAAALDDVNLALDRMEVAAGRANALVSAPLSLLRSDAFSLLSKPLTLANRILGLYRRFSAFGSRGGYANSGYSGLGGLGGLASLQSMPLGVAPSTSSRFRQQDNRDAVAALMRRGAIAQLARQSAAADWSVRDDALAARDQITALLDAEAAAAHSDPVFLALSDLRVTVAKDISARASNASRLMTITPLEPTTAASVAYDQWEDSSRESEVMGRNRGLTLHPLFIPSQPLVLASR